MTKRFENIEYCRAAALLIVLVYHYWLLSGGVEIPVSGINTIVVLGGEIGVTLFFVLSGFGIYCLFRNRVVEWRAFIKSRFLKIAPLYYVSILLVIGLTPSGASYLSKNGLLDIAAHILFLHNLSGRFAGTINGGLWTMGIIFQYYLIASFLYMCMKKNKNVTVLLSILLTIILKMVVYKYILPAFELDGAQYFVYGRQLYTALDNFVIGMYAAEVVCNSEKEVSAIKGLICIAFTIWLVILWGRIGFRYGVYTISVSSYLWHSVLATLLAGIVIVLGKLKENKRAQFLYMIGKNEYGIYLLHLPILQNLLQTSLFQQLNLKGYYIVGFLIFFSISLTIGYIFNQLLLVIMKVK